MTGSENNARYAVHPRPLTTRAAAEWASMSEKHLRELAGAGMLGRKVNGRWYFDQDELAEFFLSPVRRDRDGRF